MLERKGDSAGAEEHFQQLLDCARTQEAKSWELRAAMNLARLWRSRGKIPAADDMVKSGYTRFTEGFATADLVDARALMSQL